MACDFSWFVFKRFHSSRGASYSLNFSLKYKIVRFTIKCNLIWWPWQWLQQIRVNFFIGSVHNDDSSKENSLNRVQTICFENIHILRNNNNANAFCLADSWEGNFFFPLFLWSFWVLCSELLVRWLTIKWLVFRYFSSTRFRKKQTANVFVLQIFGAGSLFTIYW